MGAYILTAAGIVLLAAFLFGRQVRRLGNELDQARTRVWLLRLDVSVLSEKLALEQHLLDELVAALDHWHGGRITELRPWKGNVAARRKAACAAPGLEYKALERLRRMIFGPSNPNPADPWGANESLANTLTNLSAQAQTASQALVDLVPAVRELAAKVAALEVAVVRRTEKAAESVDQGEGVVLALRDLVQPLQRQINVLPVDWQPGAAASDKVPVVDWPPGAAPATPAVPRHERDCRGGRPSQERELWCCTNCGAAWTAAHAHSTGYTTP